MTDSVCVCVCIWRLGIVESNRQRPAKVSFNRSTGGGFGKAREQEQESVRYVGKQGSGGIERQAARKRQVRQVSGKYGKAASAATHASG